MTRRRGMVTAALFALGASLGCSPVTEVVLSIDSSELAAPVDLHKLCITITNPTVGNAPIYQSQDLPVCSPDGSSNCFPFPVSVTLTPGRQRPDDTVRVEVLALPAGISCAAVDAPSRAVISDASVFKFTPGQRQRLDFFLYRACLSRQCAMTDQACDATGACVALAPGSPARVGAPDLGVAPGVTCPGPATREVCDGVDNDCDGVADEGEVCPASEVKGTQPFSRGVFLLGTLMEGQCSADALQRFWPVLSTTYRTGYDCYAERYLFRRSDQTLYYNAVTKGILLDKATNDELVVTPPCGSTVRPGFDFDAGGRLHYVCGDRVYRLGEPDPAVQQVLDLAGVLDDGRLIVTRRAVSSAQPDVVVLSPAGVELSRLGPRDALTGELTPDVAATTIEGNRAYVLFQRIHNGGQAKELVAFALGEDSRWIQMRRVAVEDLGYSRLVTSDGNVFVRGPDPTSPLDDRIDLYRPDGSRGVVWQEAMATPVRAHGEAQMLVGPIDGP